MKSDDIVNPDDVIKTILENQCDILKQIQNAYARMNQLTNCMELLLERIKRLENERPPNISAFERN